MSGKKCCPENPGYKRADRTSCGSEGIRFQADDAGGSAGGPCGIQRTGGREECTAPRSPPARASEATAALATSESPADHWLAPGARRAPEKRKTAVRRDAHTPARVASTCSRSPPPLRVEVILPQLVWKHATRFPGVCAFACDMF